VGLFDSLRKGTQVYSPRNEPLGMIDRWDNDTIYISGRPYPRSSFDRFDNDRLYFSSSGYQQYQTTGSTSGATRGSATEEATRVPLHEERLNVGTQPTELGEVQVRKEVTSENVNVPVELRRDEVTVHREQVAERPVSAADGDVFKEETIRVPVRGEQAVVNKEAVVTGEVVIDREQRTERQNVTDTVRREVAGVDHDKNVPVEHSAGGVSHWDEISSTRRQAWEQRAGNSGRRWQDVEPGYHYAHEMQNDSRYRGRAWSEVEPELRSGYGDWSRQRGYRGGDDAWQRLHQDVEEAWEETHSRAR